MDSEGGVKRAVKVRVAEAWSKRREMSRMLMNKATALKNMKKVYDACIIQLLLYEAEAWGPTMRLENVLIKCDRKMMRYIADIIWRDGMNTVAKICVVKGLSCALRSRRLRSLYTYI